jgi:hypothetical protein
MAWGLQARGLSCRLVGTTGKHFYLFSRPRAISVILIGLHGERFRSQLELGSIDWVTKQNGGADAEPAQGFEISENCGFGVRQLRLCVVLL